MKKCRHCSIEINEDNKGWGLQCYPCKNGLLRYGMNRLQIQEMYDSQEGKCKLCDKDVILHSRRKPDSAYIDHCHITGKVRGILCLPCNTMLGYLEKGSAINLDRVKEYLT